MVRVPKHFVAQETSERFVTGVNQPMLCQMTRLRKRFAARVADEGFFAGVDSLVCLSLIHI